MSVTKHIRPDIDKGSQQTGAAMAPPNLDPLGEERAASMADEGGRAGAEAERQKPPAVTTARRRARKRWVGAATVLVLCAAGFLLYRLLRA